MATRTTERSKGTKTATIFVNTHPHDWDRKDDISYEEVVELAYPGVPAGGNLSYSVMYERAHGNSEGTLVEGESVKVKHRMRFDVTPTDRS